MKTKIADSRRLDISGNGDCPSDRDIFTSVLKHWRQKLGYCSIFAAIPAILATHVSEARSGEVKRTEASAVGYRGRGTRLVERLNMSSSSPSLLKRQSEFRLPHQQGSFATPAPFLGKDDCPGFTIPGGNYPASAPYTDSGDTTGANNTVAAFYMYSFGYQTVESFGPDHVYSFILTGLGPKPQIEVSTTSGTYRPLTYVLEGGYPETCPAGSPSFANNGLLYSGSSPGGTATIDTQLMNRLPLNVPLYLFVDSARHDDGGPYTIRMEDVTIAQVPPNPIDSPDFFVHRQYLDFLSRWPDAPGQAFWTDNINKCSDPARRPAMQTQAECIDTQKVNTSAAFFLSPEFQYTGYFVYRLYKGSLTRTGVGRPPTYLEFREDVGRVAQGIIQNNQLSADVLESNKRLFANEFTQRQEFHNLYRQTSNFDYVERLFQTTGVSVSAQEKQALVQGLDNRTETRVSVLRKVVDGTVVIAEGNQQFTTSYGRAFYEKEFNAAFVLMEYFGYLNRDPDPAGYQHWLDKLNLYGNYSDAEMVKSFITSPEYRARFGQP